MEITLNFFLKKLFIYLFMFLNQCMFKFAKVMKIVMIMGKIVYVNTKVVVVGNISRLCFFLSISNVKIENSDSMV